MTDVVVLVGVCMCVSLCEEEGATESLNEMGPLQMHDYFFITQPLFHLKINPSHLLIHSQIERSTSYIEQWSVFVFIQTFVSWLQENVILFTFLNTKLFFFLLNGHNAVLKAQGDIFFI